MTDTPKTWTCSACSYREEPCTLNTTIVHPDFCPGDGGMATWIEASS